METQKTDGLSHDLEWQHRLMNENKSLRALMDSSEAGMYVVDYHTGEVLYANRNAIEFFGYNTKTAARLLGKICWKQLNPESDRRCTFCIFKKLVGENGELLPPYTWERFFPQNNLWLRIISQAIIWADGRLVQMNTYYDITEVKRMQSELALLVREKEYHKMHKNLQLALDTLPAPAMIMDVGAFEILYVNNACLELFDYSEKSEIVGKSVVDMIPAYQSDGTDSKSKVNMQLYSSKPVVMEFDYLSSKKTIISTCVHACAIEYRGKKCTLSIITNLATEREQQRLLQSVAEKERAANVLKSNFLSNMSHEIRTPMNAVIGLTEIELRKKHSEESMEVYKKINISAKNLLQIVNDILDMSKIEADKLDVFLDVFELEEVINNALLVASARTEGKRVEMMPDISIDLPRYVIGDKTRLWQILKNVLDNAAKFTQEGFILLSVFEDLRFSTNDTICISFIIEDTGIGMSKSQIQKAFMPYKQIINDAQKKYTGTGLGLPLSKRICELMGGTMKLESKVGSGTIVGFTIPFQRTNKCIYEEEAIVDSPLEQLKILVIDDSELSLRVISSSLKSINADCFTARNGDEALELIKQHIQFDVVLLDYVMKDTNGFEVAKKIRKNLNDSAKILMVTAYGNLIERDDLEPYGIDDIIEKPFVPSLLYNKLYKLRGINAHGQYAEETTFGRFNDANILVCEDNDINQQVVAGMLEQFNIYPVFASDGKSGVEIVEQSKPFDLILMDVHMPIMDGFEATRIIRTDPRYDNIPIVSLTADAMTEIVDRCLSSGMNDYLSKPFDMVSFYKMLLKWLPKDKYIS